MSGWAAVAPPADWTAADSARLQRHLLRVRAWFDRIRAVAAGHLLAAAFSTRSALRVSISLGPDRLQSTTSTGPDPARVPGGATSSRPAASSHRPGGAE